MTCRPARIECDDKRSNLVAMIDVVFLLLVFFVMTFKVVVREGDFQVKAPSVHAAEPVDATFELPMRIRLAAGTAGELREIHLDDVQVADLRELTATIRGRHATGDASTLPAAIIRCDHALRYEHAIQVVAAVRGPRHAPLVSGIQFDQTGS